MKPAWGDLNARVRGLGTRLLEREELQSLALAVDLPELATALARRGFPIEEATASATTIELGIRRRMAELLRILGRWCGTRSPVLSVMFDDEDRRSLRAIARGIGHPEREEQSVAALLPTPALPERALAELARQPSIRKMAALLGAWGHPFGAPLAGVTGAEPDLLQCEIAVNRAFAARALLGARRAGRNSVLLAHVREVIDIENAYSALILSGTEATEGEAVPEAFLEGGHRFTRELYDSMVARREAAGVAGPAVVKAFAGTPLAAAFGKPPGADLERSVLEAQVSQLRGVALRDPLGPAPVVHFALRLRGQLLDLQRITWGVALNAPRIDLATVPAGR